MRTMKKTMLSLAVTSLVLIVSGTARADWNENDPAKWVQMPDLSPLGLDVKATYPKILADDFECISTGPITKIHIWGSWNGDYLPYENDPTAVTFRLSIYADIPAGQTYSMPADPLWQQMFYSSNWPYTFTARPYATVPEGEGWYDPNTPEFTWPADYTVWQYNFDIPEAEAFVQEGSPDAPIVYWLGIEAFTTDAQAEFGWKTSLDHWNDDAVWMDDPGYIDPNGNHLTNGLSDLNNLNLVSGWHELRYPYGHEYEGQSIDLAFVIAPEPITLVVLVLGMVPAALRKRQRSL